MPFKECPLCKKMSAEEYRPFCSKACKTLDLNRWFQEVYVIPSEEAPELSTMESLEQEEN